MDPQRIITGYDGSEPAQRALRLAAELAVRLRRPLTLVVAAADRTGSEPVFTAGNEEEGLRLADAAVELARSLGVPEVEVALSIEAPDDALVLEVGRGASLLVVGHRARGGLGEWILGSTARAVVDRAPCSVLVVR